MRFRHYLADQKFLIIFFVVLLTFISLVVSLDWSVKIQWENLIYIDLVSIVFFIIYLLSDYLRNHRYYQLLQDAIKMQKQGAIYSLPKPHKNQHRLYQQLLERVFAEQQAEIENFYQTQRENAEYIDSWVHQVKTPIAVSRLIIENNPDPELKEKLMSIEEEIDEIDDYVEQALYYSKINDFNKDYFIQEIELKKVAKDVVKKHMKTFISKKISLNLPDSSLVTLTDKKWLRYILDQVLANALKYSEVGGKIRIDFGETKREKWILIEDQGIGIRPEDINRVFEKGFTGYNGREHEKSTGMGLYLARKLAQKLGHELSVESEYGQYTRITIHFPRLLDYFNL